MQNWPAWLPIPRSWFNGLLLILLMTGLQAAIPAIWWLIAFLIQWFPRIGNLLVILVFLVPIPAIAFLHHWLHRGLDQFFPDSRLPEIESTSGLFPGLLSWWEGLYGWVSNYLSLLIATALLSLISPLPNLVELNFAVMLQAQPLPIVVWQILPLAVRLIIAAYFYQFEYVIQRHLMAIGASHHR